MMYISIREIYNSLLKHPLMDTLTLEYVLDYAFEFMRIVGIKKAFEEKEVSIHIEDYRGEIPQDYYRLVSMYHNGIPMIPRSTIRHRDSNAVLHNEEYKIQGNIVFTSFKEGCIVFRYLAISLDKEGYPTIPDDSKYIRALEAYIKFKHFSILFDTNMISGSVYAEAKKQYAFYVGQAQSAYVDHNDMEVFS